MAGNASELVADYYDPGFYAVSPTDDPFQPTSGYGNVRRGCNADLDCTIRTSDRGYVGRGSEDYWVRGFRCARTP
jgi:formylglycine-generating enzyme required for sulfatase activity